MNLLEFYTNFDPTPFSKSDKGTTHDYISGYYNTVFSPLRSSSFSLVEIGIAHGNSAKLWRDYFTSAKITVLDNMHQTQPVDIDKLNKLNNLSIIQGDAYTEELSNRFSFESIDILIDDGPHTLSSQQSCIDYYYDKIKPKGKIIIEDVNGVNLSNLVSYIESLNLLYRVIDLRPNKNRYDDIIIEITKITKT
jgi:hypothetical protein